MSKKRFLLKKGENCFLDTLRRLMIKAVIFDLDDTLYNFDSANKKAFSALAKFADEHFGWSFEQFQLLHDGTMKMLFEKFGDVAASHNRLIRYQNLLFQNGKSVKYALEMSNLYWSVLIENAVAFDGLLETLEALKKRGLFLEVGTNMTAFVQFLKLEKIGVLPFLDYVVSSEEAGADKPAKQFFDYCVEKTPFSASECLFVGDSVKHDVNGALNAGLQALRFFPDGNQGETIANWQDLLYHI